MADIYNFRNRLTLALGIDAPRPGSEYEELVFAAFALGAVALLLQHLVI